MPSRLGAHSPKLRAKLKISTSIRHDPAFGIAPQVMRREVLDAGPPGSGLHNMPDRLWRNTFAPDLAESAHASEDPTSVNARSLRPAVDSSLRPNGYWNCADVL